MLPLEGVRVVELTTAWAGPMAGRILAWYGAEAFHIESPTRTNTWRSNRDKPSPLAFPDHDPGDRPWDRVFTFNSQNVNKRSLVVDLKHPHGASVMRRLVDASDVLICNFRPGLLERLGLGYAQLAKTHPELIVVEMPAFGLDGPHADYAALGPTMEMAAGMSAMVAYPGGQPTVTGPSYLDPIGGFNAAAAILTALRHRERTGRGQHIELAQVEAAMQFIGPELIAGTDVAPEGNHVADMAPHNAYPTRGEDEWIAIAAEDDAAWSRLAGLMGQDELARDPRFATLSARKANEAALDALLAEWTAEQDKAELAARLQEGGVAAAAVETAPEQAASEYLAARGFFDELVHAEAGRHRHPGLPLHSTVAQGSQRSASPCYGEANGYVLREVLGLPEEEVEEILASGAMADVPAPGT
ncbi:crotonobetainyl-CoA:carnitine CoA-transferase CaiB-like acyl-CoA transferase [Palleronia aestuarii]|uniref:Crotonobetainyl-CoA:carnitine CoA-transferase CaiB-like acyl-CoA transferase n=1 Tax=Palleronia aestuarii TaxID=568105 RepID=A0A2W7NBG7_9RHOB|nr:CoA transferase [Palleronia aestuarii]PZX16973.1 crotonobetainyl-CoA:carnitine CoA-transferase CaiB-like acyl-CoA transferase [Palleronia aestuarii]